MTTKRSRIVGSYGAINDKVRRRSSALRIGAQTSPAEMDAAKFPQGILTLSPPEDLDRQVPDNFLDKCWYCHAKIAKNEDIFMYGQFRAFCRRECREVVIEMDAALEQLAKRSSQIKAKSSKMNSLKGQEDC